MQNAGQLHRDQKPSRVWVAEKAGTVSAYSSLAGRVQTSVLARHQSVAEVVELSRHPEATPLRRLHTLKMRTFDPSTREARVARALGALEKESTIDLSLKDWITIAESTELEDQG